MKFSIITPVYNRADCIARCIESVLNQKDVKDVEYEHIIVNDGSKDSTDEIIKKYHLRNPAIIYINFKENKGTNAARNAAIQKSTGDFCIILDSDDYFVENALSTINETIQIKPGYKHYMFTPDDRKDFFDKNELLKEEQVITYKDFLSQKYNGDFVHVIKRETMQKFPFDEKLRIYEGIFFLKFYKEAECIYFKNTITTIRERGRNDSVTKEYIRTNEKTIRNAIKAIETQIKWYYKDYIDFGLKELANELYIKLFENYLLISDYINCNIILKKINEEKIHLPVSYKLIYCLHLGSLYKSMLYSLLKIKYSIFKIK